MVCVVGGRWWKYCLPSGGEEREVYGLLAIKKLEG